MCCDGVVLQYHQQREHQAVKGNHIKGHNDGSSKALSYHPPGPAWANAFPPGATEQSEDFLKGEPVILGVSQIMTGLMNISLWIMVKFLLLFHNLHLHLFDTAFTFIVPLGPIFIRGSLGINTVAAILAGLSLIILACSLASFEYFMSRILVNKLMTGIVTVELILTALGLIISVSLSAFGCCAICCDMTAVVVDLSSSECRLATADSYHDYDDVAFQPT